MLKATIIQGAKRSSFFVSVFFISLLSGCGSDNGDSSEPSTLSLKKLYDLEPNVTLRKGMEGFITSYEGSGLIESAPLIIGTYVQKNNQIPLKYQKYRQYYNNLTAPGKPFVFNEVTYIDKDNKPLKTLEFKDLYNLACTSSSDIKFPTTVKENDSGVIATYACASAGNKVDSYEIRWETDRFGNDRINYREIRTLRSNKDNADAMVATTTYEMDSLGHIHSANIDVEVDGIYFINLSSGTED